MATALRIILGFIVILFFVGITFSTFFTSPKYLSIPDISSFVELDGIEGIFSHSISDFSALYSDGGLHSEIIESAEYSHNIDISTSWKYISSLRNEREGYSFSATGFLVKQEGVWEIFFDTITTPGKTFIYAINTPATLSLVSDDGKEKYVDIHLTPHMYIEFQANKGKYLKNADRIRIGTVFKLWYIGALWIYEEWEDYMKKYLENEDDFLDTVVWNIDINDIKLQDLLVEFSQQNPSQIPGYDSIQRYIHFFVNDDKKIVFYKNKVLEWYLKILKIQSMDTKVLTQTNKDLEVLKLLSTWAYTELIQLQDKIRRALHASNKEELIIPRLLFSSFLDSDIINDRWYFPLYSFSLFSSYDRDKNFSYELSKKFLQSFPSYVKNMSVSNAQIELRYDYFLYYLERQLLYLLSIEQSSDNITSVIITLENYVNTALRHDDYSATARVTRLFVFSHILEEIDFFLRWEYFLLERTNNGVLGLDLQNKISLQDVIDLKENVNMLYDIYDQDKNHLNDTDSRDIWIIEDITQSRSRINEYFSALENYETYKTLYDVSKTNLLALDTFSSGENDILSIDKMEAYFSQFIWISVLNTVVTIQDNLYYHVEKLNISGKVFSFDISPSPEYKITNIYIDGFKQPIQYKLWNIQYDWNEKYKAAPQEQRDQYDFSRFFILTFFKQNDPSIEEYVTTISTQEDKTEIVFKKDILLGNPWEFTILKDFLTIEYEDITLEKDQQDYNIYLDDIDFNVSVPQTSWGDTIYKWVLKSQYVLNNTDHYFKWVSMQIYKKHDDIKKEMLFGGSSIYVGWKIHISDMKETIETLATQLIFYNNVYWELGQIWWMTDVTFQYTVFNDRLSIKFASQGKRYTILLRTWEVESIYKESSKITSWTISPSEIKNYIQ